MDIATARKIIKNITQIENEKFEKNIEKLTDTFMECITFLNTLPYNDFKYIYNELFKTISVEEIRFTKLFLSTYCKIIKQKSTIRCFDDFIDNTKIKSTEELSLLYNNIIATNNYPLRFANFDLSKFPEISENAYQEIMAEIENSITHEKNSLSNADYVKTMGMLSIARVGGIKYGKLYKVYAHFISYLELITKAGEFQQARDALEELVIASEHDSLYYCGLIAKLVLAVNQQRNFEALFILLFARLEVQKVDMVYDYLFYILNLSTAQLFRNLQFYKQAKDIFKSILSTYKLDDYNLQLIWHSYFSCKVSEKDNTVIQEIENYLNMNTEKLLKSAENSSRPWINLLCAIKDIFNYNSQTITYFLELFNRTINSDERRQFYDSIGFGENLKQSLILNLNNIYKSAYSEDIAAHLKSIEPIVNRAIEFGLKNDDYDILLMATIARSIPFSIQDSIRVNDELIVTIASENKKECTFIEDFCDKFKNIAKKNNILLFNSFNNSVFCVAYIDDKITIHKNICSVDSINSWVSKNLSKLGFVESREKNGQIEGFEMFSQEESKKIQDSLPQFILNKITIQNECLIFSDVSTLKFPINLIRDNSGYISEKYPINFILPSFFHREEYSHSNTPCINLFGPKEPDLTVTRGIEIIQEEIELYLRESQRESKTNDPKITIFIGHGYKDDNKFKGIYCNDDNILLPFEFPRNCLNEIIILFICHAGFSSNMLFYNDSLSIAKELIFCGARHVIAPAWPLNIKLTGPWIKTFINQIKAGKSVRKSCFLANMELKKLFKIESAWSVMHHYEG